MKTRIISGLAMVPFALLIYFGGWPFLIGCFLVSAFGVKEFYDAFSNSPKLEKSIRPSYAIGMFGVCLLYVSPVLWSLRDVIDIAGHLYGQSIGSRLYYIINQLGAAWVYVTVLLCLLYLFKNNERRLEDAFATLIGVFYIGYFSHFIVFFDMFGEYDNYDRFIWLVFITAFGTDVMAYFTGYFLGKHKLCPSISPKKTIEGSVGGILGSVLFSGIFGYLFIPELFVHCLIIGAIGSVLAQLGDLTASIFKRKLGIKDYGNLIPGHGGVLDRFDSVLFTAPFIYYYAVMLRQWIL